MDMFIAMREMKKSGECMRLGWRDTIYADLRWLDFDRSDTSDQVRWTSLVELRVEHGGGR